MSNAPSNFPRIWSSEDPQQPHPETAAISNGPLVNLRSAFESLTGWTLAFEESRASYQNRQKQKLGLEDATGKLVVDDLSILVGPERKSLDRKACQKLADSISTAMLDMATTRADLRKSQLELATCTAASIPADETARVEGLLRTLLTTALEQFGFVSASLWMVDDDELSMRQRMAVGPHFPSPIGERYLGDSRADVRAMTGNLIVIDNVNDAAKWQAPVRCNSAVCLPVSSLSNLYGTLWLVRDETSPVSDHDTCMLEIIAGRIACELERVALSRKINSGKTGGSECDSPRPSQNDEPKESLETQHASEFFEDAETLVQPPFEGWHIDIAPSTGSIQGDQRQRWTGYRVTAAETLMFLSIQVGKKHSARKINSIRSAFEAYTALNVSPALLLDGIGRLMQQKFDCLDELSLCCLEMDPLTGEYRWTSCGAEWGSLSDAAEQLATHHGAATLAGNASLTLSAPNGENIWQPALIISRRQSRQKKKPAKPR